MWRRKQRAGAENMRVIIWFSMISAVSAYLCFAAQEARLITSSGTCGAFLPAGGGVDGRVSSRVTGCEHCAGECVITTVQW